MIEETLPDRVNRYEGQVETTLEEGYSLKIRPELDNNRGK